MRGGEAMEITGYAKEEVAAPHHLRSRPLAPSPPPWWIYDELWPTCQLWQVVGRSLVQDFITAEFQESVQEVRPSGEA